jgi:hypothetical protein
LEATGEQILRVFRFRPAKRGFDETLRTVMLPELVAMPGMLEVIVGRQGPDERGLRLVVSLWQSRQAMATQVGEDFEPPTFHPELLSATTDHVLGWWPLTFGIRSDHPDTPHVLRHVYGTVRPGELSAYVADARAGTIQDASEGRGPLSLYLVADSPDSFQTVSAWPDWATVERATGGDVERPIATRHTERLVDWKATHYEVVPAVIPSGARTTPAEPPG